MAERFKAILISRDEAKKQSVDVVEMSPDELMDGDVDVRVEATTVNYKDGLAITGKSPVVRRWPMIPGVDLAGTVERSDNSLWKPGDKVILNGWGVGETHYGAYAGLARLKSEWLVPRPERFSARDAMIIGTAGYTAMLSVLALEKAGLSPKQGPVVVTGASGGVGSFAIALLAKRGWEVLAVTGRTAEADYLKGLGAAEIVDRAELSEPGNPLAKERWIAAVDAVGSHTLANVLAATRYNGVVTSCGLAQGMDLPTSVAPFILRGVTLVGIDSVMASTERRVEAWQRLAEDLDQQVLESIASDIGFDDLIPTAQAIVEGRIRGRAVATIG
ncbi:acrylyl-CoA reductase (NADPH) [Jiella marina]|uniref:acrylyl-CoA reductase (NADPH) n=1 Tax=Jiella sp. LLJ827 TaxID=2917712 RepID=UPI0021014167|nr:MDR family oxidoreductase [Jiella sp. LLJ827]MCQ0987960.1 oxidoreductase [Jiella sp. LLJ827]